MSPGGASPDERLFEVFTDLVKMDSESGHEAFVRDYLREFCANLSFTVHEDDAGRVTGGDSGNLVVSVPGGTFSPPRPIMLCAHMDTVAPGRSVVPFDAGDRFISLGDTVLGADCKAALAAILCAAERLVAAGGAHRALELVFTVQEESGLIGAKNLDTGLLDSEWGIVLDGSGPVGGIVVNAPGQDRFKFVVRGKAAHAGVEPEKGASAITCAAHAIAGLPQGRIDDETTLNVGLISGGRGANIVPELAVIEGEVRSRDPEKLERARREVLEGFEAAAREHGCELEPEVERTFEQFRLESGSAPVRFLAASLEESGFDPFLCSSGGGSDANVLNRRGIETAVMNIGLVNAHSTDEYITKADLAGIARTVERLAGLAAEPQGAVT